jgi:uracil-DNA glycosylase
MILTATPRAEAAWIACATNAAVSTARWKSYCASSSDVFASPSQSAIASAISSGCWPPSVRVRTVSFVEELAAAEIGATFNFYREGPRAGLLRRRLAGYLAAREHARFLLVGEAPGYRGARVSGLPFMSERQLTGAGPAEATATIVRATLEELELEEDTLCWNVVPTHPGTETTNRRPTQAEIVAGRCFLGQLARGRRVIAVGRIAAAVTDAIYVRHPSHGGAEAFRSGLLRFAAGGRPVRHLLAPRQTSWLG